MNLKKSHIVQSHFVDLLMAREIIFFQKPSGNRMSLVLVLFGFIPFGNNRKLGWTNYYVSVSNYGSNGCKKNNHPVMEVIFDPELGARKLLRIVFPS